MQVYMDTLIYPRPTPDPEAIVRTVTGFVIHPSYRSSSFVMIYRPINILANQSSSSRETQQNQSRQYGVSKELMMITS